MKKSKSKLLELAAALEADFSANDDKQIKRITVASGDGVYRFAFEQEGMPPPDGEYDIDIDLIPTDKKQAIILNTDENGFSFQIKSKGVHFQDQPIDCATSPVTASIKITYFDGLND